MSPDAWGRVSATLDQLLGRPESEHGAFLADLRETDPDLCRDVESLLDPSDAPDRFHTPPSVLLNGLPSRAADAPTFDAGKAGRYEILGEIARGGMGAIYRARDPAFDRSLAVKVLLPRAGLIPDAARWFAREAKLTGRLQHPGIPPVHDLGTLADGTPFFAMKLIEGRTLAALIADGGDDWAARRVGVFEQVGRALAYAHSQKVIHRDLKPGNVMVGAFGEVQVMDWGLAKSLDRDEADGPAEGVAGTPAYMAPEQALGEPLDERCDVFGLGGLLCVMVTGRPPFAADSPREVLRLAAAGDTAPALAAFATAGADVDLVAIATRCLQPDPAKRYRNAQEVADAVTTYRESLGEKLRRAELDREAAVVRAAEERRRRRVVLGLAASLVLFAVGGVAVWAWAERVAGQRRARAQSLNDQTARVLDEADDERAGLLAALDDPVRVNAFLNDLSPWQARLKAVEARIAQAAELAESGRDILDPVLADRLAARQADHESDRADLAFARQGDALRSDLLEQQNPNTAGRYQAFADVYARRGWSLFDDPDLRTKLAASPIRWVVQANLDDLASLRMTQHVDPKDQKFRRLLELGYGLERDEFRKQVRNPEIVSDPAAVDKLTRDIDPRSQTPQMIRFLASLRSYVKLDPVPLLRAAQMTYQSDLWLLFDYAEATHRTNTVEALAAQRAALALRPNNFAMMNNLGTKYMRLQDFATAAEFFRRCLELQPKSSVPAQNLAYIRCELDPNPGTVAALREARRNSKFRDHFDYLGTKYAFLEDYAEAEACYRKAVALEPNNAYSRKMLDTFTATLAARDVLKQKEAADPRPWADFEAGVAGELTDDSPADQYFARSDHKRAGYRIRLDAGIVYAVRLTADFEADLTLETDAFKVVSGSRDSRPKSERFTFTVPAAGVYRLTVVGAEANARGKFDLTGGPPVKTPAPVVLSDALTRTDDSAFTRYRDHKRVDLGKGETLVAELRAPTFEPKLVLFDPAGAKIFESMRVNPFDPRWTRIEYTAPKAGTYTVTMTSVETDRVGDYTVTLLTVPAPSPRP